MKLRCNVISITTLWFGLFALVNAQNGQLIPDTVDIEAGTDLKSLPNNSLYLRWRPRYHVLAPGGHMNDPCGPMYDPAEDLYHIFYQSFPQHVGFGNTSWSHATSPDLISWTDVRGWENRSMVAIPTGPFPQYDWIGAFSGGAQAVDINGEANGNLTLMYTGASRFPDNWQVPYKLQSEQQAIATSSDGGQTWQKYAGNPVVDGAPGGWNVTGLRDPIFQQLPELDEVLGHEPNSHWYITLGSGIRGGVGPRMPLYSTPANDLTDWTFLGALFEVAGNVSFGGDQSITGNYGYNFELVGIFVLPEEEEHGGDSNTSHWVITMGAEGYSNPGHPIQHWSLFAIGTMSRRDNGSAEFTIEASGVLDWAGSYAFNQFYDPIGKRRVVWGWTDEDMLYAAGALAMGYAGTLNLPREVYMMVKHNVVPAAGQNTEEAPELWSANGDGTYTIKTIGQHPLEDVVDGIQGGREAQDLGSMSASSPAIVPGINSSHCHIQFTVDSVPDDGRLSVLLRATPDFKEYVNMTYFASNSSIVMDRSHSTLLPNLTTSLYVGHFRPYTYRENGKEHTEPMVFNIYIDGSLIEVFINDRYAHSTRSYPSRVDSGHLGFEGAGSSSSGGGGQWGDWSNAGSGSGIEIKNIRVWDSMKNVWPDRPLNASSPLEFDVYYETHLTFPNPYVDEGYQFYDGWKRQ